MGWLSGRSAAAQSAQAAAVERLERLARQWQPVADVDAPPVVRPSARVAPDERDREPSVARVRVGGWTRAATRALVVIVVACLAVTGWWWWSGRPREVVAPPTIVATGAPLAGATTLAESLAPTASATEVVVHVTGLVARPGLVSLPPGSRVADAVAAAGGVTKRRAADSVNLARVLIDGEQIVVSDGLVAGAPVPAATSPAQTLINLNTADQAALEGLPGIGPVIATRIIEWRLANGAFRSIDELGEVSGIGDATLVRLRALVGL